MAQESAAGGGVTTASHSVQRVVLGAARRFRRRSSSDETQQWACSAPFTSMYLDQFGNVRACCQNVQQTLGNITERSLSEIWHGEPATQLRAAMVRHDYSLGCQFCKWQVDDGNANLVFARTFDHLSTTDLSPRWPQQLELSMSNACNLQCVMCNGDWSSAIRTHREGRPPLPAVYEGSFFEELRDFLPHLRVVKFLGGEPFLSPESLRVMEMLADEGLRPSVHVTTNGTQWSRRVERFLESLPMTIVVSIDGCTKETYESIRVGAKFDVVMENLTRFQEYARSHGTSVNLAHCLMTANWREFPDYLRFAEARGLTAYVNTVTAPVSKSLFHLPPSQLTEVVRFFEQSDAALSSELRLNLALWNDQLERFRHHLQSVQRGENHDDYLGVEGFGWRRTDSADRRTLDDARRVVLDDLGAGAEVATFAVSVDGTIREVLEDVPSGDVLGIATASLVGVPMERVVERFIEQHGEAAAVGGRVSAEPDLQLRRLEFDRAEVVLTHVLVALRDDEGVIERIGLALGGGAAISSSVLDEAEVIDAFLRESGGAPTVEVRLDINNRIEAVTPSTLLGARLDDLVGQPVDQLAAAFVDHFGSIVAQREIPTEAGRPTTVASHEVTCENDDGVLLHLRSLSMPLAGPNVEGNGSRILLTARREG